MKYGTVLLLSAISAGLGWQTAIADTVNGYIEYNTSQIKGRLFVPADYDSSKSYPLVVFLAGAGEIGKSDNTSQISTHMSNLTAAAGARDFIVYAPQTPRPTWETNGEAELTKAVGQLTNQYNVNRNRVYVTGLSAGGEGTLRLFQDYGQMFGAYVPLSPSGNGITNAQATVAVNTPMWLFHGQADANGPTPVGKSRGIVNQILAAQGQPALTSWSTSAAPTFNFAYNNVHYTEYYNGGHNDVVWNNGAYSDSAMYDWLLAQNNTLAAPAIGKSVLVNLSIQNDVLVTDSQQRIWNNAGARANGYLDPKNIGTTIPFAVDSTGQRTTLQVSVSDAFSTGTANNPTTSTEYDSFATSTYWTTDGKSELTFTGLTPGGLYDMDLFASIAADDGGRGYSGLYSANGVSGILNGTNNLNTLLSLSNIAADSLGNLVLTITPTGTSRYAVLNTLTLTAVPEPMSLGVIMGAAGLLLRRRNG